MTFLPLMQNHFLTCKNALRTSTVAYDRCQKMFNRHLKTKMTLKDGAHSTVRGRGNCEIISNDNKRHLPNGRHLQNRRHLLR